MQKDEILYKLIEEVRDDVKEIRKEMTTLKIKVAGVSSLITIVVGFISKQIGL